MAEKSEFLELRKKIIKKDFCRMNAMQFKAVTQVNGPVLVLAGAGSGKTTVLVNRIACMIKYGNAYKSDEINGTVNDGDIAQCRAYLEGETDALPEKIMSVNAPRPWEILAITFTNKAAGELKDRIVNRLGEQGNDLWAGTFHSVCGKMLRRDAERVGYTPHYSIYDTDDCKRLMKDTLKEMNVDEKIISVKTVLSAISSAKDELLSPEDYKAEVGSDFRMKKIAEIYGVYQQKLVDANAMDFDDMIFNTVRLLSENPDIKEYYNSKFKYVMVDEYQDTNHAQYVLCKLLSDGYKNICVVGDDDQSIYRFRGATIENILSFEERYRDAVTIRLEQNYRSTGTILDAANAVISNNMGRKGKNLWTDAGEGEKIEVYTASDDRGEAKFVADTVLERTAQGGRFSDNAVLYRMNAQSRSLENVFVRSGIPYRVIGGTRFYERKEIKDILSYLNVINNTGDTLRLIRIINEPARGIGKTLLSYATEIAENEQKSLFEIIRTAREYKPLSRSAEKMEDFAKMILTLKKQSEEMSLHELINSLLEMTGYISYIKTQDDGEDRAENIKELVNSIYLYEQENEIVTLSSYLEDVALLSDIDNYDSDADTVVMMTLHSAKGLEFDTVFLIGLEEGIFPGAQSAYGTQEDIEEERRLAYVGITRAKKQLYITNSQTRMMYGTTSRNSPSRFLSEIPKEYCNIRRADMFSSMGRGYDSTYGFSSSVIKYEEKPFTHKTYEKVAVQAKADYKTGERVKHKTFGEGTVIKLTPMGNDTMIEVAFDTVGTKKLMSNYAKLEKI